MHQWRQHAALAAVAPLLVAGGDAVVVTTPAQLDQQWSLVHVHVPLAKCHPCHCRHRRELPTASRRRSPALSPPCVSEIQKGPLKDGNEEKEVKDGEKGPLKDGNEGKKVDGEKGQLKDGNEGKKVKDGEKGPLKDGNEGKKVDGEKGPLKDGNEGKKVKDGEKGPLKDGNEGKKVDSEKGPLKDGNEKKEVKIVRRDR
ncbi:hypothetical protein niasHT_040096 [Heterodera trifolii]|uniref:Uncharacterized protein n=1 Tax=Heterodera trifolii TaxID=157864 RepID=A0ABD2HZJ4_9BILA